MNLVNSKLNYLIGLNTDENWNTVNETDNILTQKKILSSNDVACFKSSGFVNTTMNTLLKFIWNIYDNYNNIKQYDPDISKFDIIENLSENTRICYQVNNLSWPCSPREFIYLQTKIIMNNECYILMYSVDSIKYNQLRDEENVKAYIIVSGFCIKERKTGCEIHRITHIDPAGSIPLSIVNNNANKTKNVIKKIMEIYN